MAMAEVLEPLEHELDPSLQREVLKYPGKWVAVTRSKLVAVGDSPAAVLGEAARAGYANVILHRVPEDGHTINFF